MHHINLTPTGERHRVSGTALGPCRSQTSAFNCVWSKVSASAYQHVAAPRRVFAQGAFSDDSEIGDHEWCEDVIARLSKEQARHLEMRISYVSAMLGWGKGPVTRNTHLDLVTDWITQFAPYQAASRAKHKRGDRPITARLSNTLHFNPGTAVEVKSHAQN